ncbi:autoinducer 2 ABC transporter substrate-binding protein [Trueperella sp. LYQ143]|uniref:autoinducer 2 ABC transporter substrate-binding protein n=1 Tax=Trueperella sp. LYQ143 TaxID=3391059 RepID=UPI0039839CAE
MKIRKTFAASCAVIALALAGCAGGAKEGDKGAESGSGSGSGEISVAFVPKIQGIPFFEAMNTGGAEAAKEFGFKWVYSGPTTADPAAQADVVRSLIQQNVSALMAAPNDPDSLAPLLKEAQDGGIRVGTSDTDAPNSVREVFVSQASPEGIGDGLIDQMAKSINNEGKIAIVSCGQTAANLNTWIDIIKKKVDKDYPKISIVDVVYADEDQARAVTMAKNLMSANPDLKGLIGPCTTAAPGVAQAVEEAGKIGQVQTVGVGTPKAMLPYLQNGAAYSSVLWNVEDHGYLTAWAGWQLAQGKEFAEKQDVGHLKNVTYDAKTKTLLLGEPLILTKDNAGKYNY